MLADNNYNFSETNDMIDHDYIKNLVALMDEEDIRLILS